MKLCVCLQGSSLIIKQKGSGVSESDKSSALWRRGVGRFTVEEASLYFNKQDKNKPMLIWCGNETLRCYVCLVPVCMQ